MVGGSLVAPKFQGLPLKIATVKPWIRACFAQSPTNALQFLITDGRRASLILPTGKVLRDLHGLEACRDKIVRVSASYDGSCVVALTSDGNCWLHNCALGQSQAIELPPEEELPFQFSPKVKRQQLWDLQLEACAATSLVCFSWLGSSGALVKNLPFSQASNASNSSRDIIWAKHEEQTDAGVIVLGTYVCSASMMSLEGWMVIETDIIADVPASDDSWKVGISCSLFSIKDGSAEPTGSCVATFTIPSPFSSLERTEWSRNTPSLHSSRRKPAILAVHGGEGLMALILNCQSPCLYFFKIDSSSNTSQHPKICLPLDSVTNAVQEFVCDATWVCKGWWLVLLLSTGRLLVFDRRGVLLSWTAESASGAINIASGTNLISSIQMPNEMLALCEAEWTVSAHPLQPYVAVCTGFFIAVVLLPSPSHFITSHLSVIEHPNPPLDVAFEYAFLISRTLHPSSQPSCALDVIVILSHLWCLALSNPCAVEFSICDKLCKVLSSSMVSAAAVSDSKRQVLVDSLRSFLTAGHQATYLCPHVAVNQSQKLDFACIQVIVSALVNANAAEDAAVLLCACRKRCDVARNLMLRPQYISCVRFIMNAWSEISVKELQVTATSETAALQGILAAESISVRPTGSFSIDRKKESIIARAIDPSATAIESSVCFCRAGQSVAALAALINGGHLAAVVAATLRMQGVLTGSSCTAVLSAAIHGKCWKFPLNDLLPIRDSEDCKEDASIDDCLAFILKTSPRAAVQSVVRLAATVCALSLCSNSNIELICLHSSQCIDTQSEFVECPVFLRLRLSTDPTVVLGNNVEHQDYQSISVRSCSLAFKDVLAESCDHVIRENSPPSGLELASVLCLLTGCGAEAALLAVASVEIPDIFASLSSFCDDVSSATAMAKSSPFAARIESFKASVCDWFKDNVNLLSSFFLSPANIELLQFCSKGLPVANLPSQVALLQSIDQICSEAVKSELLNVCRNMAGDHNVALNSTIKDACLFLTVRSRSAPNVTRLQILFFWEVLDNRRSALKSSSGSLSSKMSATAMTKSQLLLEFSIVVHDWESSFLDLSATFCVDIIEVALRSGSGSSISREQLLSNISLLCLAVRKGAISEQRHKLRAIAQSIQSLSLQAHSMLNSLFESDHSGEHDAELEALEQELTLRYDRVKEAQSSSSEEGIILELKASANSVLVSLSEELWVCHSALMASFCLNSNETKTLAPVVIVPHLIALNASSEPKLLPDHDMNDSHSRLSRSQESLDHSSELVHGPPRSVIRSQSPKMLPPSQVTSDDSIPFHSKSCHIGTTKVLSPLELPPRVSSSLEICSPHEIPVELLAPESISSEQLFRPSRKLDAHECAVNTIVVSVDGSFLFSAGEDASIKKWQLDRCFCVKSVLLDHAASCLAISFDGKYIFSAGNEIVVWTHDLRRVHTVVKGCQHPILSIALTNDLILHATTCGDAIKKFHPMNEDLTSWSSMEIPIFGSESGSAPPCAHPIIMSRSGDFLYVGKNEEYVLRSQLLPHSFALNDYVLALAISADEKVVASGGTKLCIFRVDTGEALRSFDWTGRWITCVVLSYTARVLFSAGSDGKVHIWDCFSGACISSIQAHTQAMTSMILSQDQQWLYTASKDCSVKEWNIASLPGMQRFDLNFLKQQSFSHQESLHLSDSGSSPIIVETASLDRHAVERDGNSELVESAPLRVAASLLEQVQLSPPIAVAPSIADVLSGMRSESSLSSVSDDDFDSNFSRISSAIERLQGSMRQHAPAPVVNFNESDYPNASLVTDSDSNVRFSQLAERVSRPQRLHILSKAKSTLMQQQLHSVQSLPPAHFVVDLADVNVSSDEKSSPPRSPAITQPSPSVVHGSMYMPVTSPQASPRQQPSRVNVRSSAIPATISPRSSQDFSPQELRARARRQQERINHSSSFAKAQRSAAITRETNSSVVSIPASNKLPIRLLRVSSSASTSQVAAAAGAPLLLPLPVQSKSDRLSALAPSLLSNNTIDIRLLAPRPSPAITSYSEHAPDQPSSVVNSGMLVISPDELQQLVHSAVSSAMIASAKAAPPPEATVFDSAQPVGLILSPALQSPPPTQSDRPRELSPQNSPISSDSGNHLMQNQLLPQAPALLRESRSAIVQTDGEELPRSAPSPLAQSTRQAINDAYNFSLPPSRHVQVVSVAPGVPVSAMNMNYSGPMEARSVAVMRGQPPVVSEETLSPDQVSRLLLSGHHDGFGGSAASLGRKSLSRQFSTQPDPVQLVSASLSAFERKLTMLEQQAAQVEVNLGISGQRRLQSGRSVLDSINSRLGAVLDNDLEPEPPLIPSQLSSELQPKVL